MRVSIFGTESVCVSVLSDVTGCRVTPFSNLTTSPEKGQDICDQDRYPVDRISADRDTCRPHSVNSGHSRDRESHKDAG